MNKQNGKAGSDRFDAMLYVLDDPSLDRTEFERRLEDDPHLGELVAEAVCLVEQLKPALQGSGRPAIQPQPVVNQRRTSAYFVVKTAWLATIAAALIIVASCWQFFHRVDSHPSSIAQAWSDLQRMPSESELDDSSIGIVHDVEGDLTPGDESDLPDWLLLAVARNLNELDAAP